MIFCCHELSPLFCSNNRKRLLLTFFEVLKYTSKVMSNFGGALQFCNSLFLR